MSISTMHELEQVPVGSEVCIDNDRSQVWIRTADGFSKNGVDLSPAYFSGAVEAGLVRTYRCPIERGNFFVVPDYHDNRYAYLVVRVNGDLVHAIYCYRGRFNRLETVTTSYLEGLRKAEPPPFAEWALALGDTLLERQGNRDLTRLLVSRPDLVPTFQAFGVTPGGLDVADVEVTGTVEVEVPLGTLTDLLPEGVSATGTHAAEVNFTVRGHIVWTGNECIRDADDESVSEYVGDHLVPANYDDYDYDIITCSHR